MSAQSTAERDAFLSKTRLGILTTLRADGSPVAVPVWFEWDGRAVRIFSNGGAGKIARLERDPRTSLIAVNDVGEPEAWVAFDGRATISSEGALDLALRLADRYWDMSEPEHQESTARWRRSEKYLRLIEIVPERIRTSIG